MEIRDTKKIKTLDTGASGFERLTGKIQNSTTSLLTEDMKDIRMEQRSINEEMDQKLEELKKILEDRRKEEDEGDN